MVVDVVEDVVAVVEVTGITGLPPAVEVEPDMVVEEEDTAEVVEDSEGPRLMAAVLRTAVEEEATAGGKRHHTRP